MSSKVNSAKKIVANRSNKNTEETNHHLVTYNLNIFIVSDILIA